MKQPEGVRLYFKKTIRKIMEIARNVYTKRSFSSVISVERIFVANVSRNILDADRSEVFRVHINHEMDGDRMTAMNSVRNKQIY